MLPGSPTRVSVTISDILQQTGSIVVGSNDTFDTDLGEVISPDSLQGQLLVKTFGGEQAALDRAIVESLAGTTGHHEPAKSFGKQVRYPIGTVAVVQQGARRFFLVAFCRMLDQRRVSADVFELWESLRNCWAKVRDHGQHADCMPILGRLGFRRHGPRNPVDCHVLHASARTGRHRSLTAYPSNDVSKVDC